MRSYKKEGHEEKYDDPEEREFMELFDELDEPRSQEAIETDSLKSESEDQLEGMRKKRLREQQGQAYDKGQSSRYKNWRKK